MGDDSNIPQTIGNVACLSPKLVLFSEFVFLRPQKKKALFWPRDLHGCLSVVIFYQNFMSLGSVGVLTCFGQN